MSGTNKRCSSVKQLHIIHVCLVIMENSPVNKDAEGVTYVVDIMLILMHHDKF